MTQRWYGIAAFLSLALAVAAPLVNVAFLQHHAENNPVIRVNIEPYDPRDLFYGQYLRFRVDWNWKPDDREHVEQVCSANSCCLCVEEGDVNPVVSPVSCDDRKEDLPSCRHILRGEHQYFIETDKQTIDQEFKIGTDRYFVDERYAKPLELLFFDKKEKFTLELSVAPDGKVQPRDLFIGDFPLKEYLAVHGDKMSGEQP